MKKRIKVFIISVLCIQRCLIKPILPLVYLFGTVLEVYSMNHSRKCFDILYSFTLSTLKVLKKCKRMPLAQVETGLVKTIK